MSELKVVLDEDDVRRTLVRIAHEIVENNDPDEVALVGIHRRGAVLAQRLKRLLGDLLEHDVPLGELDISFYRDDVGMRPQHPVVHSSHIDFPVDGITVVLVDAVLYTGRTVRAAIDALFDYGRPQRVQLAVLTDRGHRELPIRPDYVGKNLPTARSERIQVDGEPADLEAALARVRPHAAGATQFEVLTATAFAETMSPMASQSAAASISPRTAAPIVAANTGLRLMKIPNECAGTRRSASRSARNGTTDDSTPAASA